MKRNHFAPVAKTRLPAETSCGLPLNNLIVHIETLQFSLMWWDCFKFCLQIWEIELSSRKEQESRTLYLGSCTINLIAVQDKPNRKYWNSLQNSKVQRSIFQCLKWHVCQFFERANTWKRAWVRICKQGNILLNISADKHWALSIDLTLEWDSRNPGIVCNWFKSTEDNIDVDCQFQQDVCFKKNWTNHKKFNSLSEWQENRELFAFKTNNDKEDELEPGDSILIES